MKSCLDIIWNISLICPWDCEFCCTDAVNVTQSTGDIIIRSRGLEEYDICDDRDSVQWPNYLIGLGISPNYLDKALYHRQKKKGLELSLKEKLTVLNNLESCDAHIDFAGGDPLACAENFIVIKEAAKRFGRNNISVTSTGHSLSRYPVDVLCKSIGVFEFTYDEPRSCKPENRPRGYNASNLKAAEKLNRYGIYTKCQIPLHEGNLSKGKINEIVSDLTASGIDEVLLMRTFPVGRGLNYLSAHGYPEKTSIMEQIEAFKTFSEQIRGPRIRLQCALKNLYKPDKKNPCDLMKNSFGINFQGLLLLSAWATNSKGEPLADEFILGSLVNESFDSLAKSNRFRRLLTRLDENWGHCKIFSFLNSRKKDENAIFSKTDPLYIEAASNNLIFRGH